MKLRVPLMLRLFWDAIKGWSKDDVPRLGASLAYYTLFAVSPILVIAIAIAGAAFGAEAVRGQIVGEIDGLIGKQGAEAVQSLLQGAHRNPTGTLAVIIGTATLIIAASGAFLELQHALNTIFRVKTDPKKSGLERLILSRLRSFGLVVSIGFLLSFTLVDDWFPAASVAVTVGVGVTAANGVPSGVYAYGVPANSAARSFEYSM